MRLRVLIIALAVVGPVCFVFGQSSPGEIRDAKAIARIGELLDTRIETKHFQDEMPLPKFLVGLQARLPKDKKVAIRIDEKSFGKDLPEVLRSEVRLPAVPKTMNLGTALRVVLSQVRTNEADYDIEPAGIVVTHPRGGARTMVHEVRDLIAVLPSVLPNLITPSSPNEFRGLDRRDGGALLLHFLLEPGNQWESWETIELRNDARLIAFASPNHQRFIADACAQLRRRADLAVVMNARIYDIDRAFFARHIAPALVGEETGPGLVRPGVRLDERPLIVPIGGALLKKILKQKLVVESDDVKLRLNTASAFLSRLVPFAYDAGEPLGQRGGVTGIGVHGVRFTVRAELSPDRFALRLRLTQEATRLVGIGKARQLSQTTGDDRVIEVPTLQRSSATGTITLRDGDPLLMPIDYRPPGKGHADKVWVLVARPVVWIQEEKDQEKAGNVPAVFPKSIWECPTSKELQDAEPPAPAPPLNDDTREVLQAVLTHVLTDPQLKQTRAFYGSAKGKAFALVAGELSWPKGFQPVTHGYTLLKLPLDPFEHPRHVLGITLQKFDLRAPNADDQLQPDGPILVTIRNVGGAGGVIGSCLVSYAARRVGKRWTVEFRGAVDP
jgi:hypothetical protein